MTWWTVCFRHTPPSIDLRVGIQTDYMYVYCKFGWGSLSLSLSLCLSSFYRIKLSIGLWVFLGRWLSSSWNVPLEVCTFNLCAHSLLRAGRFVVEENLLNHWKTNALNVSIKEEIANSAPPAIYSPGEWRSVGNGECLLNCSSGSTTQLYCALSL